MKHVLSSRPEPWIELGKTWAIEVTEGISFKEFCKRHKVNIESARYHLKKYGFKTNYKHSRLRGDKCDKRNDK